jgi:hypothetical protein
MTVTTSIDIRYKQVDGMHIFDSAQVPGFYVANRDPKRAFDSIIPTIEMLVKLDTGIDCTATAEVPFSQFIGNVRADAVGTQQVKRVTLVKEAA